MAMMDTPPFSDPPSDGHLREGDALDAAIARARAEIDAMARAASTADTAEGDTADYALHEVMGVGRYVIPRRNGWLPLINIIHDPAADIDFSLRAYPLFDDVIDDHFNGAQLSDPIDDQYEHYRNLRDNIAAVRNFLMQTYYVNTPKGITPEKARAALEQIAAFVGDGLHNNLRLFGVIPNHNPTKPFISLSEANRGDGIGAQYLYEKILEMQRQSNWMRPFAPIVAMFGGKPAIDWMLPGAFATPFHALYNGELAPPTLSGTPTEAEISAAMARLQQLEGRRAQLRESAQLTMMAVDLDAIGNHLLFTADNMSGVASLSEPLRREAVDIAKDILRKLKISIGNLNILEGLKLKPTDDLATLGAVKGVVMVYERLLAWGRGIDPSILQHPSVLAATQAVGQLGYLAKLEAMRVAQAGGNTVLASKLAAQLKLIPQQFAVASETHFGGLLDRVERGIDTVLNRIQEINGPGAMVGHLPAKELGAYMTGTPIAGQAMLLSADGAKTRDDRNAAILEAQDLAERALAQRIQAQTANRAQGGQARQAPARSATGRQAVQQARTTQQRTANTASSTNPAINAPGISAAQRAAAMRNAFLAAHAHNEEEEERIHGRLDVIQPDVLSKIKSSMNMSGVTGAPVATGRASYDTMLRNNAATQRTTTATTAKNQLATTEANIHNTEIKEEDRLRLQGAPPPGNKGGGGGGRGL